MKTPRHHRNRCRGAFVLVVVLIVLVMLTLGAFAFTNLMIIERDATDLSLRKRQTLAAANSGVDTVRMFLAAEPLLREEAGGCWDNFESFCEVPVLEDEEHPEAECLFSVVARSLDETGRLAGLRYGLQDESARLNLRLVIAAEQQQEGAGRAMLMKLPGMTEEIAESLLDWIDDDDDPRELGAEADFYLSLASPMMPANAMPRTIDELTQVRDVSSALMFGLDTNRNGRIEKSERARYELLNLDADDDPDDYDGDMDCGWYSLLTLWSAEKNVSSSGEKRINLNEEDLELLAEQLGGFLSDEQVAFIIAYRQNGPWQPPEPEPLVDDGETPDPEEETEPEETEPEEPVLEFFDIGEYELDLTRPAKVAIESPLDLLDALIQAEDLEVTEEGATAVYESPFSTDRGAMADYMPVLLDMCTTSKERVIAGRININQAPRAVLMCLPGLTEEQVDLIVSQRPEDPSASEDEAFAHPGWLLAEDIVTLEELRSFFPLITTRGDVYRAEVVGFHGRDGQVTRVEVVFDATHAVPEILMQRDISHLGRGYSHAQLCGEEMFEETER